jgi:large subunit ribosomal protein L23
MNKKAMKVAFSSILSELLRQNRLKVIDSFTVAEAKTKALIKKLAALGYTENVLVVVPDFDYDLMLAARNIPNVSVMEMHDIDPVDLVGFGSILMTVDCVKFFEEVSVMLNERLYEVVRGPHVSEKATILAESTKKQLVLEVAVDATKAEIKTAVEKMFNVLVDHVTTCHVKAKTKRVGRIMGKRKGWKKAYVTLVAGQDVQFASA